MFPPRTMLFSRRESSVGGSQQVCKKKKKKIRLRARWFMLSTKARHEGIVLLCFERTLPKVGRQLGLFIFVITLAWYVKYR